MYTIRWNKARGQSWVAKVVGEGRTWPFFCRVFLYAKVWYSLEAHHFALRRDSENTSERVIRRLVHAPGMPAAYQFTRRDEQSRHNYTFATDSETGGLVMTAPKAQATRARASTAAAKAPSTGSRCAPSTAHATTGRCATPTETAGAPSRPPRTAGTHGEARQAAPPRRARRGDSGTTTSAPADERGTDGEREARKAEGGEATGLKTPQRGPPAVVRNTGGMTQGTECV